MSYYPGQRRGAQTITAFILFLIGIGLTIGLYYVKTRAQSAKLEVSRMEQLVSAERVALNVLKAEIAHLESPARVAALAEGAMGLKPTDVNQVVTLADVGKRLPQLRVSEVQEVRSLEGVPPVAEHVQLDKVITQ